MKTTEILFLVIIVFVLIYYRDFEFRDLVPIKSEYNGKEYLVQDTQDKQRSANILSKIEEKIWYLVDRMNDDEDEEYHKYIRNIIRKRNSIEIMEVPFNTKNTSFTLNKNRLVFCLKSKSSRGWGEYHDINLIMYVVLHEISHIACPEDGHTRLFAKIFNYIAGKAVEYGVYDKIDFANNPRVYCGMELNTSII